MRRTGAVVVSRHDRTAQARSRGERQDVISHLEVGHSRAHLQDLSGPPCPSTLGAGFSRVRT
jgi:hypothetical protein